MNGWFFARNDMKLERNIRIVSGHQIMLYTRLYNEKVHLNFKTMYEYMNTDVQYVHLNPSTNTYDIIVFSIS
jgi:hypothetical protein